MANHYLAFQSSRIDPETDTIRGVSLISLGEAKGHDLWIDQKTLSQVFHGCLAAKTLKVRADHGSGVLSIIGYLDNFTQQDGKVLGDLHLYASEPAKDRVMEMAAKNPHHLGLSIEFSGPDENLGGKIFARCSDITAAALVSDPAANKSLFSDTGEKKNIASVKQSKYKHLGRTTYHTNSMTKPKLKKNFDEKPEDQKEGKVTEQDMSENAGADGEGEENEQDAAPGDLEGIGAMVKAIHDKLQEHGDQLSALHAGMSKHFEKVPDLTGDDDEGKEDPLTTDPNTEPETQNIDQSRIDGQGSSKDSEPGRKQTKDDVWEQEEKGNNVPKIKPKNDKEMSSMHADVRKLAARLGLRVIPTGQARHDSGQAKPKNFEQLVTEKTKELNGDKAQAILFCIKNHKSEYAASRLVGPRTL